MKTAELDDATQQFHERFGVYPNLMGGGPELYKKIDEIIQDDLENVVNDAEPVEVDGPVVARRYGVA